MGWTRGQLVDEAFVELGLGSATYDIEESERLAALRRLEAQMFNWGAPGLGARLGYIHAGTIDAAALAADSGLPGWANEAVFLGLAKSLAPGYGKTLSRDTKVRAKEAYDQMLCTVMADIPPMQLPGNLPSGAGNRTFGTSPFVTPPEDRLTTGPDGILELP